MVVRSLSLRTILTLLAASFLFTACPVVGPNPDPDTGVDVAEDEISVEDALPDEEGNDVCVPDCVGKACGDDGCGATCGDCEDGWECTAAGQCVENVCVPDCTDLLCGPDPVCGESCGLCEDGFDCVEGACVECAPTETCEDLELECGPHPECPLQSCGDCEEGFDCEEGLCVEQECLECCLSCIEHADCEDTFTNEELGACMEPACVYDEGCPDWQCVMVPVADHFCCEISEDCPEPNECSTVDCVGTHCIYSKIDDCCLVNPMVLFTLDFDDLGKGETPSLASMTIHDENSLDNVVWTAQKDPCDDGMALYLGDPICKTYFNGELYDCFPLDDMDCSPTEECPPGSTCNMDGGINKCIGEPATAVAFEAVVPQVDLPPDAFVSLFYTVSTDLELEEEGFAFDTLKLYVEHTPDPDLPPMEVLVHTAPQSTGDGCTVFAADLTTFAPVTTVMGEDAADAPIRLIWRFDTFDGTENHFQGLWLDDIRVETYCTNCFSAAVCNDEDACTNDECVDPPVFGGEEGLCYHAPVIANCVTCDLGDDCQADAPLGYVWECGEAGYCLYTPDPSLCVPPAAGEEFLMEAGLEEAELPEDWEVAVTNAPDPETSDVTWQVTNATACEGSYALYFGNGEDYDCGQALCAAEVISPEIDLSEVEEIYDLRLSFCANLSTEWDTVEPGAYPANNAHTVQIDVLYVDVIVGNQVTEIWNSDILAGTTYGIWEDAWADLTPFKGETIRLKYRFYTGTAEPANNDGAGVFVDNVRIEKVCGTVCEGPSDCTEGGDCTSPVCALGVCSYTVDGECCTEEINADCDDQNPCTNDSCQLGTNTCAHTFTGDPSCCSPNPSVFADSLLSADNAAWYTPENIDSCNVFPYECEEAQGENCMTCPTDCGACAVGWNVTSDQSFTAPFSLCFRDPASGTYENGQDAARGFIASPDVTLPEYGIPVVSFHLWLDTEHTPTWVFFEQQVTFDILRLHVQLKEGMDSYGPMTEIWNSMAWDIKGSSFDSEADDVVWKQIYAALDGMDLEGETVRFVFEFDSEDDSNNDYQGACVDDFKVSTMCDTAFQCLSAYDCAETSPGDPNCSIELCDGADGPGGQSGTCVVEANTLLDDCCVQVQVGEMGTDFDAPCGMEDWVASPTADQSTVAWQTWDQQNITPGGECALYFGNPDAGDYDIPGQTPQGIVTSPTWPIPAGLDSEVEVSFWIWMDLEDTWSLTDVVSLHMGLKFFETLPPNEEVLLWSKPCDQSLGLCDMAGFETYCDAWGCTNWPWGQWKHVAVTIPTAQFTGYSHLNFWFEFNAQDDVNNNGVGIFVDDFEVQTTCQ